MQFAVPAKSVHLIGDIAQIIVVTQIDDVVGMEGNDGKSIPALLALEEKVAKLSIELANVKSIANLALKIVEENIVKFQMDRIAELNRKEQENGKTEATWQQ